MENRKPADLARALYAALAAGDRDQFDALLHPEFTGRTAEGMPFSIGGQHDGPAAMRATAGERSPGILKRAPSPTASSISPMAACW
jgi:ketosteroid isomerase-like protein